MEKLKKYNIDDLIYYVVIFAACLKLPIALQDFGNFAYIIAIGLSFFYLLWKMFWKRDLLKNPYYIWGIVLIILFLLSTIANHGILMVRNIRACICGVIFFFIMVPWAGARNKEAMEKRIHYINMIIISSTMIYGIIMLLFTIFRGHFYLINFSRNMVKIGWNTGRNMGIYAEGNMAGYASTLSFAVGLVELVFMKDSVRSSTKLKVFIWANQIVQAICVVISCSRTAYLITLIILYIYMCVWVKAMGKKGGLYRSMVICFLGGGILLAFGSIVNLIPGISFKPFLVSLPDHSFEWVEDENEYEENVSMTYRILTGEQSIESNNPDQSIESNNPDQSIESNNPDQSIEDNDTVEKKKDILTIIDKYSSGRIGLWRSGFKKCEENILFGGGLYRTDNFLVVDFDNQGKKANSVNYFSMHNDYIQAFVSGGIIGGMAFIAYILYILLKARGFFMRVADDLSVHDKLKLGVLFALVCGILIAGMLLTIIYFDCFATGTVFWCYIGFLSAYVENFGQEAVHL